MVTTTVTMIEDYGLYPGQQGICTVHLPFKNVNYERGGPYYPNSLEETRGSGVELQFSNYCQNLANANCNLLRVKWFGGNASFDDGWAAIEPPPYGTFNIWQTALDPDNLVTYRSQQVTYPIGAAAWAASNMKEFIEQCAAYNINLHVVLFETSEFDGLWRYHAWYDGGGSDTARYINGAARQAADLGFISNAYELYTDATAIQAAKDRIDFVVDMLDDNKAVVSWELFAEMSWLLRPNWWGESSWNAAMTSNIRDKVNPWVTTMGNYLRAADPYNRPISIGLLRPPFSGTFSDYGADHYWNLTNEPMIQYPIDICAMNFYETDFTTEVHKLHKARQYTDKLLWVTQYSPHFFDENDPEEFSPYTRSKQYLWTGICGERWGLAPIRWPGLERTAIGTPWLTGGYADSDFYSIGGVVKTFCDNVSWNSWKTNNYPFTNYISTSGTNTHIAYGDGENVTMMIDFTSGGNKTIDVTNLSNGAYTFTYYNWVDGAVDGTLTPTAAGGSLSMTLDMTPYNDNILVAHLIKD